MWSIFDKILSQSLRLLVFAICMLATLPALSGDLKAFDSGSMARIEQVHAGQPLLVAIWSVTCPPCIKELELLSEWQREHPEVALVLVSTDVEETVDEVNKLLLKNDLLDTDN